MSSELDRVYLRGHEDNAFLLVCLGALSSLTQFEGLIGSQAPRRAPAEDEDCRGLDLVLGVLALSQTVRGHLEAAAAETSPSTIEGYPALSMESILR